MFKLIKDFFEQKKKRREKSLEVLNFLKSELPHWQKAMDLSGYYFTSKCDTYVLYANPYKNMAYLIDDEDRLIAKHKIELYDFIIDEMKKRKWPVKALM